MNSQRHNKAAGAMAAVVWNILLLFVAYGMTRLAFLLENHATYGHLTDAGAAWSIALGGLRFDASAIAYTNALYLLLVLLPCHVKENNAYHRFCKYLYLGINALALAVNLADAVYYQFTARRTTVAFLNEFGEDDKLGSILGYELIRHWYLVLLFLVLVLFLHKCYKTPAERTSPLGGYYLRQTVSLAVAAFLCWAGMRGGFWDNRPININTANLYIAKPNDASLVLNTPFTILRTIGKQTFRRPDYYADADKLQAVYTPVHQPAVHDSLPQRKNFVVIFLESFGREYFGSLNREMLPGYKGYTEFLDSLIDHAAVTFRYSYANGRASIDAMPSALCGVPMFVESLVAGPYAANHLNGLAACLGSMGYETAFFHGAPASSLGFQGFCKSTGFQQCYSQEDFETDARTEGRAAYDNWWGIWDEPFLQYFRVKVGDMRQPFLATLFTLTSHHPFHIPDRYKERFPEEELPIHKTIRYTDNALRRFFDEARKEPWFKNTVFVLTGDHPNMSNHPEYKSIINQCSTSLIIYDAGGSLTPGIRDGIAQQTDILPTVLGLAGYSQPYLAFGCDLLRTPADEQWAVHYIDGTYQYCKNGYALQFDGERTTGIYRLTDYLMKHDLKDTLAVGRQMESELKAVIQQYMNRMIDNQLQP